MIKNLTSKELKNRLCWYSVEITSHLCLHFWEVKTQNKVPLSRTTHYRGMCEKLFLQCVNPWIDTDLFDRPSFVEQIKGPCWKLPINYVMLCKMIGDKVQWHFFLWFCCWFEIVHLVSCKFLNNAIQFLLTWLFFFCSPCISFS